MTLEKGIKHPLWETHQIGDTYKMDGVDGWNIAYYPICEDGKTGKSYSEARALVELPAIFDGEPGIDFREVPLRFLKRTNRKS